MSLFKVEVAHGNVKVTITEKQVEFRHLNVLNSGLVRRFEELIARLQQRPSQRFRHRSRPKQNRDVSVEVVTGDNLHHDAHQL
jgi:hypothetical protein